MGKREEKSTDIVVNRSDRARKYSLEANWNISIPPPLPFRTG